jgi:hypothetical protein
VLRAVCIFFNIWAGGWISAVYAWRFEGGFRQFFQLFAVILKEKVSEFHLLFSWIGFLPWRFWSGIFFDKGRKYRRIVLKL